MESALSLFDGIFPYIVPFILILLSYSLWSFYITSTRDSTSSLPLPPGTVGLPFVGETINMIVQGFDFYRKRREKYGHVYKTHILGKPTIRVWGNKNINKVLENEDSLVTMAWPTSVVEMMGRGGLVTSTGAVHSNRRAALLKAFTQPAVNGYAAGMERIISKYVKSWSEKGQIMARDESKKLAFETTARILLGCNFSQAQMETMMSCMNVMVENFFVLPIDMPGFGFHKAMKARKQLLGILDNIINHQCTEERAPVDAVSILKEQVNQGTLTMLEVKDSIVEMLFSAYHGMSSLCCSAFLELARHQEVTDKIVDELQKEDALQGEHFGVDKLAHLPYIQNVCKELLRFAPPYGGGYRKVLKTFELEGYQIPQGWTVLYSIRDQHEAEENFPRARTFDPDRWGAEKGNNSYIPFGGNGIRSCIGEKYMNTFIQLFVCMITRSCRWELIDRNTTSTHFPVQMPTNGLPLTVTDTFHKLKA